MRARASTIEMSLECDATMVSALCHVLDIYMNETNVYSHIILSSDVQVSFQRP